MIGLGLLLRLVPVLAASPVASPPEPRSVAILVLSSEKVGVPMSDVYAAVRQAIERETTLDVAPLDIFSGAVREDAIRMCAGNGRCFAHEIRETGSSVDLLLTVSADRLGEGVLLGLRLVDVELAERGGKDIAAIGEELPEGMSLVRALPDYVGHVFPKTIWGRVASLDVKADQTDAEVQIGPRSCVTPCRISRMRPGSYDVAVSKEGFEPARIHVDLAPGAHPVIEATLPPKETSIVHSVWFWGAIGAGAIGATVAALLATRSSPAPLSVCVAPRASDCR